MPNTLPSALKDFFLNEVMRNDVKVYLNEFFKEEAIRRLMIREDAVALADATEMLNKAFEDLEILFSPKSEGKEIKNEAR